MTIKRAYIDDDYYVFGFVVYIVIRITCVASAKMTFKHDDDDDRNLRRNI